MQSKAKQSKAKQSKAKQSKAKESKSNTNKTKHLLTKQNKNQKKQHKQNKSFALGLIVFFKKVIETLLLLSSLIFNYTLNPKICVNLLIFIKERGKKKKGVGIPKMLCVRSTLPADEG